MYETIASAILNFEEGGYCDTDVDHNLVMFFPRIVLK